MSLGLVAAWVVGLVGRLTGMYKDAHPAGFLMALVGALDCLFTRVWSPDFFGLHGANHTGKQSCRPECPDAARQRGRMDWFETWGVALGAAWLSGVKLYASVLTLGLLQRFGFAQLPGDLSILGEWWVIGVAGLLFLAEFIADKLPAVDSAWDAVHTFIRIPAGAVLAAAAVGHFDSRVRLLAFLLGGGIALTSHGTKAAVRLAVNASPEPFSNGVVSLLEEVGSIGLSLLAAFHPVVALSVVVVLVGLSIVIVRKLARGIRALFRGSRARAPSP